MYESFEALCKRPFSFYLSFLAPSPFIPLVLPHPFLPPLPPRRSFYFLSLSLCLSVSLSSQHSQLPRNTSSGSPCSWLALCRFVQYVEGCVRHKSCFVFFYFFLHPIFLSPPLHYAVVFCFLSLDTFSLCRLHCFLCSVT